MTFQACQTRENDKNSLQNAINNQTPNHLLNQQNYFYQIKEKILLNAFELIFEKTLEFVINYVFIFDEIRHFCLIKCIL